MVISGGHVVSVRLDLCGNLSNFFLCRIVVYSDRVELSRCKHVHPSSKLNMVDLFHSRQFDLLYFLSVMDVKISVLFKCSPKAEL